MTPVSTQILDVIHARLERITTVNGFSTTVSNVNRSRRTKFLFTELPGINYYSSGDLITKEYGAENHELSVSIEFADRSMTEAFNDLAADRGADIVKALAEDANGVSHNLGDLVDSLTITQITPLIDQSDLPYCGVAIDLTIQYKTANFSPYTIL